MQLSLAAAAAATLPVIELHHFLPLQISLLGIYSRLSAITVHLLETLPSRVSPAVPGDHIINLHMPTAGAENSIVIPRTSLEDRPRAIPPSPSHAPTMHAPATPPSIVRSAPKPRKKKDAMDDIFASF